MWNWPLYPEYLFSALCRWSSPPTYADSLSPTGTRFNICSTVLLSEFNWMNSWINSKRINFRERTVTFNIFLSMVTVMHFLENSNHVQLVNEWMNAFLIIEYFSGIQSSGCNSCPVNSQSCFQFYKHWPFLIQFPPRYCWYMPLLSPLLWPIQILNTFLLLTSNRARAGLRKARMRKIRILLFGNKLLFGNFFSREDIHAIMKFGKYSDGI